VDCAVFRRQQAPLRDSKKQRLTTIEISLQETARGFESLLLRQLALTKKMQAKIPHFGAGFLRLKQKNQANAQQ